MSLLTTEFQLHGIKKRAVLISAAGLLVVSAFEISSAQALILGLAVALLTGNPLLQWTDATSKLLLKACIIALGFRLNFDQVVAVSGKALTYSALSIGVTFFAGLWLGRKLGVVGDQKHLITSGTAICGGSAIATIGSSIQARSHDMSVALAVVFILNSIALIVFPWLGEWLSLSQEQFGLWAAMAIHDTSSVVGASAAYGEKALDIAVTVKLVRALWIIPIATMYVFLFKRDNTEICIPWFMAFFVLASLSVTFIPQIEEYVGVISLIAKKGLVITLFLIGMSLTPKLIRQCGATAFIFGTLLWIISGSFSLALVLM